MSKEIPELGVAVVRFGKAQLDRVTRELLMDGKRAPLGPRGIALLTALLDARDRTLSKQELLDTVWRGVVVEENNLQVQISTLRRLLGPQAIATIPGRGYRFMLPLEGAAPGALVLSEATAANEDTATPAREGNLSASPPELIGREAECAAMQTLLLHHPLVSVVGAAGIGKTRLAIAAAHALQDHYKDGVWVVELAALNDVGLLVQSVARTLRIALPEMREPIDELATALLGLEILMVIDNCEHLVDEVGTLVGRLLKGSNSLRIMTTSQEPLKVVDEHVFRLGPLEIPSAATVDEASSFGALRLFIERVRSYQTHFKIDASTLEHVIDICRRVDGMPLAIELAAARVPLLGVAGVRERLGERFRILTGGSRFAPKRHQTLRAALDWSHALLNAQEQAVYRRLGVFVGTFSLESAQELAESDGIDAWAVLEHMEAWSTSRSSLQATRSVRAIACSNPRASMRSSNWPSRTKPTNGSRVMRASPSAQRSVASSSGGPKISSRR